MFAGLAQALMSCIGSVKLRDEIAAAKHHTSLYKINIDTCYSCSEIKGGFFHVAADRLFF